MKQKVNYRIIASQIEKFALYLRNQERAESTIQKYTHDLWQLCDFLHGETLTRERLIDWKGHLARTHAPVSVNSMLAAVNAFFVFMEWPGLKIKPFRIQRTLFRDEAKELTREEYMRLVRSAQKSGNERLSLVLQTICATGIRVSELRFITVQAANTGHADVSNKGKRRQIFLPEKLCRILIKYCKEQKITAGAVFVSRSGRPLDRSNIWREMKALCESAGVMPGKVFPHNLRHLFARTYYSIEKDLSRLADILGHSNVSTTRIYTAESGYVHARQIGRLGFVIT